MEISGISALRAQRVVEASPSLTSTPRTRKAEMPEKPPAEIKPHGTDCQGFAKGARQSAEEVVMPAPITGCPNCVRTSRFGNCTEPVAAGLADRFVLVRHPAGGRGCPTYLARRTELDERAARLLACGAIEPADVDLVRERQHAQPAEEWAHLLDWCEAAAPERAAGARKVGA